MSFTKKLRSLFGAQDMTIGSPMSCLLKFSIPLLMGNLAQQMYNTVDAVIVGRFVGTQALASVGGSAAQILGLLVGFFVHSCSHLDSQGVCYIITHPLK